MASPSFSAHVLVSAAHSVRGDQTYIIAVAEMKAFLVSLVSHFIFEWDGRPIEPKLWVVARPHDPVRGQDACVLRVRPRHGARVEEDRGGV